MTAAKRFKLTTAASPFIEADQESRFGFKVRFDQNINGLLVSRSLDKCPLIRVMAHEIVQTTNKTAQEMLAAFHAPTRTVRNGIVRGEGPLFEEVTDTEPNFDLDLDPIFASAS